MSINARNAEKNLKREWDFSTRVNPVNVPNVVMKKPKGFFHLFLRLGVVVLRPAAIAEAKYLRPLALIR